MRAVRGVSQEELFVRLLNALDHRLDGHLRVSVQIHYFKQLRDRTVNSP
jgi:hypothetical protein